MAMTDNLGDLWGGSMDMKSKQGERATSLAETPFDLPESAVKHCARKLKTLKVLVVDDEEYDGIHANLLLKRMGITAQYAKSGHEAIRTVLEAHEAGSGYDVCIVDWRMPGMDGVAVTRKIREKLGSDPLMIVLSAYDWSEIEEEARRAGVNAFVAKPLVGETLYPAIEAFFGTPANS